MRIPAIRNVVSETTGKPVPHQFIIDLPNGDTVFQSHDYIAAIKKADVFIFDVNVEQAGKVTLRYLEQFTGMTAEERAEAWSLGLARRRNLNPQP